MAIVYKHIRLDNNQVFYVGIGKSKKRAYSKKNRNKYWNNIVKYCGYEVDVTLEDLTWEEACFKEKELINIYGRKDLGLGTLCNLTDGGDGTLNIKFSEEKIKYLSEKFKGTFNPFFGKKHTQEVKNIISAKAKGRIRTSETRKKISESIKGENCFWFGKKLSNEHKFKLSEKRKGTKLSISTKDKLKINSPKRIEIYRLIDNQLHTYSSFRQAELYTGLERRYIKRNFKDLGFIYQQEAIDKGYIKKAG